MLREPPAPAWSEIGLVVFKNLVAADDYLRKAWWMTIFFRSTLVRNEVVM